jgi:hypothetical protein
MSITDGYSRLSAEVIQHILVISVERERFCAHHGQHRQEGILKHDWGQECALETVGPEPMVCGNTSVSKDIGDIEYDPMRRHPSGAALCERELRKWPVSASTFV